MATFRVLLVPPLGGLEWIDVEGVPHTLDRDGVAYRRFEYRGSVDDGVKGYFYAPDQPSGNVMRAVHEQIAGQRYGTSCPVCGDPVKLSENVMPWGLIEGIPHIAHTACFRLQAAVSDALEDDTEHVGYLPPFEYRGHSIEAHVRSAGVSAAGDARISNASWTIRIDGDREIGGPEAGPDDTLDAIRPRVRQCVDEWLDARREAR